ncbi:MAG: Holliday junction resolvase RuvX [Dehalococcoidia bacterium]|nr:Holliday junction resolvase RuvX [Dehalococcoidia bacterium]
MRILGLDVGDKRIGVAMSDPMEILASTLTVIERKRDGSEFDALLALVKEHKVGRIVVGYPRSMDGTIGHQAEKTQAFAEALLKLTDVPVELSDEQLSTSMATDMMRDAGRNRKQIKARRDTAAAALILQWYLNEHRPEEPSPSLDGREPDQE